MAKNEPISTKIFSVFLVGTRVYKLDTIEMIPNKVYPAILMKIHGNICYNRQSQLKPIVAKNEPISTKIFSVFLVGTRAYELDMIEMIPNKVYTLRF